MRRGRDSNGARGVQERRVMSGRPIGLCVWCCMRILGQTLAEMIMTLLTVYNFYFSATCTRKKEGRQRQGTKFDELRG